MYLLSDGAINIEANADNIANRTGIQVTTAGAVIPVKAESGQVNAQSIGTSSNYFNSMYTRWLHVNMGGSGNDGGITLYNASPSYAIYFRQTSSTGTHSYVNSDWATYFTMDNTNNRGWIFKRGSTNVASISGLGYISGNRLMLNRVGGNPNGRIYWYSPTYYTWVDYMSDPQDGFCPTNGKPSTTTEVTSWARRSLIENAAGFGWIWEATNDASVASTTKPTARMSLSSNTGRLRIEGNASSPTNVTGQLIVSSELNGGSNGTAIELWRGGNASWQLANEAGTFYIRCNYNSSKQTTYSVNGLVMDHTTGAASLPYLALGQTNRNTSYKLYVNGTSYFNGNTTHNGIDYFANGTTYYINNSAQASLNNVSIGGVNFGYKLYVNGTSYFSGNSNVCKVYNSANYNDSSSLTLTQLAAYNNASCGMINAATDNPRGAAGWVHVWSQAWSHGVTSSWVSQIALNVQDGAGMWYRTTSGNIDGRAWIRVLDTNNYTGTLDGRYVNVSGDTMTGALDLANGTWNKVGDDASFGDNNTAGSFAIKGLNGNTNLKMVTYNNTTYGTITWDGSQFVFSNSISGNLNGNAATATKATQDGNGNTISSTYLKLSGGTMGGTAEIVWPDSGNWGNSNSGVTFPVKRGGLKWYGQSDWIGLYSEESSSDMLNLIAQFGDDSSSGIKIRTHNNVDIISIMANGTITASKVYGAVWNDYAEYRSTSKVQPGQCVIETGLGNLVQSTKRLQPGANIVSDTFGFAIGETEQTKTPLAVSGRVLAYPYEDRYSYSAGDPVCSGPNGTISKMTRKEVREYPDRIVGTVSEIPEYETWGTGNVKVNGRIWIKVK